VSSSVTVLTVGTYNHWRGGVDDGGGYGRLREQVERLAGYEFDVLVSTEGYSWGADGGEALWAAADRLGMWPLSAPTIRGQHHVVVWVRPQRVSIVRHVFLTWWPHWHAQARVWVEVDGVGFAVVGVHMSPNVPDDRRRECEVTGAQMGREPTLLLGDLNDPGRGELGDVDWAGAPPWLFRHGPDERGRTTGDHLARYGFVDVAEQVEPDPARRAATAGFHHEVAAPQRRDRVLHAGLKVEVLEYEVGADDGLSDHRLVRARLQLARVAPEGGGVSGARVDSAVAVPS
jgi:endonuclease/exonuclease/phosphatase family metal-dependent hydrolase